MIKNERQYRITRSQIARFEAALKEIAARNSPLDKPSVLEKAEENALRSQLEDLKAQVSDYESLQRGDLTRFRAESFDELPVVLIKARIATGMTQSDLAARLGLKEQQVQRYEATEYASASFERLKSIVNVLGVEVHEEISVVGRHGA